MDPLDPPLDPVDNDRRRFCQLAGLTLAAGALPACGGPVCGASAHDVSASAMLAVGQAMAFETGAARLFVCRDAAGLYALDGTCTHVACKVDFAPPGFHCPCHGATYDFAGATPTMPAQFPLAHVALCKHDNGALFADVDQVVDAAQRLRP